MDVLIYSGEEVLRYYKNKRVSLKAIIEQSMSLYAQTNNSNL